jgi:hypothetical protein
MKGNLGSEVLLMVETFNEVNSATIDLLQALVNTWYAVSERGGLRRTERAVTTCCLPLNHGIRGKRR